jgi:hypothetical protein
MIAQQPGGPNAAAQKYDLLTMLGVVGLGNSAIQERSMLRLITLVTARYNWRSAEITVGRREIARLWGVDERTVKREMARLRGLGFVKLLRPGVRGRVATYGVDFEAIAAVCDCTRIGPDFVARIAANRAGGAAARVTSAEVIPFPHVDDHGASAWTRARAALRDIGEAAHQRWIAPLVPAALEADRLVLRAPSAYHASYVERTYGDAIRRAVLGIDGDLRLVRIVAAP